MNRTRWLLVACGVPVLLVVLVLLGGAFATKDSQQPPTTTTTTAPPVALFTPDSANRVDVGKGTQSAAIFSPREPGGEAAGAVVVLLHGWAGVDPSIYGPWIDHLVRRGTTVVYPVYQEAPFLDVATPLPNTLVALRAAFEQVKVDPARLVVAGHSAGGALSSDYAASAAAAGLPKPAAVFSVYPGRSIGDVRAQLRAVDGRNIAPGTRMLVFAGAHDKLVGTRWARQIARSATRANVTLRIVRDRDVDDHAAPARDSSESRRTFWRPLDALLDATK